jgi:hypothetical protein
MSSPLEIEGQLFAQSLRGIDLVEFSERLRLNIHDPDSVEEAVFRSPEFAERSWNATRRLLEELRRQERDARAMGEKLARGREIFRQRVGVERRTLDVVLAGLRAQNGGIGWSSPNPRMRAFESLARKYPQEYLRFLNAERRRSAKS